MKTKLNLTLLAVICGALLLPASQASAQFDLQQVLPSHRHCGHVIDLLMRYGTGGGNAQALVHPSPFFGGSLVLAPQLGDLELVSVVEIADCTDECGPTYGVTIRNNSERDVAGFSVSAVTVLGRIHGFSPSTTVKVDKLCVGEAVEVPLKMPIECLALGRAGAETLAFQTLVVAIDSFDELIESDESNNLLVINRLKIPVAAPIVESVEVPPGDGGTGEGIEPQAPIEQLPNAGPAELAPAQPAPAAPETSIDLDNIMDQLDQPEAIQE